MTTFDARNIPIIGQTPATQNVVPEQLRLDATEVVGKVLAEQKRLGLRFGRIGVSTQVQNPSAHYLLTLEKLEAAGCRIISVCEHPAEGPQGQPMLVAYIIFRAPETLFGVLDG